MGLIVGWLLWVCFVCCLVDTYRWFGFRMFWVTVGIWGVGFGLLCGLCVLDLHSGYWWVVLLSCTGVVLRVLVVTCVYLGLGCW